MREWNHDALAEDLAICKQTSFLDTPLGSVQIDHAQRADVLEVKPSYTRFCVSIYEIKISRADFQKDIRTGKWKGYLDHCHRFYFAVPSGLVKPEEIPKGAGLIVRGEKGWKTLIAAERLQHDIPEMTLMSLIFSRQKGFFRSAQYREKLYDSLRWKYDSNKLFIGLGANVADALQNKLDYERERANYEYMVEDIKNKVREGLGETVEYTLLRLSELVRQIKRKAVSSGNAEINKI